MLVLIGFSWISAENVILQTEQIIHRFYLKLFSNLSAINNFKYNILGSSIAILLNLGQRLFMLIFDASFISIKS
jgi:hypothetical protein